MIQKQLKQFSDSTDGGLMPLTIACNVWGRGRLPAAEDASDCCAAY